MEGNTSKHQHFYETGINSGPERAYLIAVDSDQQESVWGAEDSLNELGVLARTAGASVIGSLIQRLSHPDVQTYLGKGRTQELTALVKEQNIDLVIADDELTPTQQRNLEQALGTRIVDRTALILDIFAQHARTREGRLQVELALLEYRLPRLSGGNGATYTRQAGGSRSAGAGGVGGAIGVRGPGETKLELDRRRIRSRIADLKQEIEEVRKQRALLRQQRVARAIPVVAIVGYTNAGKSTLFNALTQADVLAENKLFATLDPVTRHITLPGNQEILMTDTVGFIQKLPTDLVAAFRATLEEVVEADVLLEVVDISHEMAFEQNETVNEVLTDLEASDKLRVTALNKIDLLEDMEEIDTSLFPNAVPVSALTGQGLEALLQKIADVLAETMREVQVLLPFNRGDLVELFHRRGVIAQEQHEMTGTLIRGRLPRFLQGYYAEYAQKSV